MLLIRPPYYNYSFGALGRTLASARASEFFRWFHLEESERRSERPEQAVRFRPSGEKFHELCNLDVLVAPGGAGIAAPAATEPMVGTELVVARSFLNGRDALFAQDLVKSFLFAALPDACRDLLHDFIGEMDVPGGNGQTPGFQVFRGRLENWKEQTGWSRLRLANVALPANVALLEGPALVVAVCPNPSAPNAELIEDGSAGNGGDNW